MSASPAPAPLVVRTTAREVLHPDVLRDAWRLQHGDAAVAFALRVGLAAGTAIAVPALAGHRELSSYAALGALTALFSRAGSARRQAPLLALVGAVMVGAIALFSLVAASGAPAAVGFLLTTALAAAATALVALLRIGPPGATVVVFCAGAGLAGSPGLGDVAARTLVGAGGAALAWVVCLAGALAGRRAGAAPHTTLREQLRASWGTEGWRLAAVRVLVGGLAASGLSAALGLGHTSWAVMGATAVLAGATARHTAVRAVQRATGTAVGAVAIAYPLLAAHLGFWQQAALVVVLQVVTEIVVGRHYGLAQLCIAPMALLMTSLGGPAAAGTLALDRALDTTAGALAGLAAAVLVHRYGGVRRRRAASSAG
ncbi:FUSC family protein [Xylanimonas protaetiae]|uniref:FUSC family protein n=1 Tax=Xylanimonas protaetiae TaxID=2509457 RepID=A0A4P6F4M9_9MICO|nr:FUSC family protein [Xylanimonas protaetiae]QAY70296.1 FUSC family protein [Xylanimonas protaetiae]